MPEPTTSSMQDARDAYDTQQLDAGNFKQVVADYHDTVMARARVRARNAYDAEEIASRVLLHLLEELARGKQYTAPFRVVVHQRLVWEVADFYRERPNDAELGDWDTVVEDDHSGWIERHDLGLLFAALPERERDVLTLRWIEGLEPVEIAARLGITRNNVDQALWRGHRRLREDWGGG